MGTLTITARAAEDPVGRELRGCWTLVVDVENASRQCRTIASEGNAESTSKKLGASMSKHSTRLTGVFAVSSKCTKVCRNVFFFFSACLF